MQIVIDTTKDDAGTINRLGLFLISLTVGLLPKAEAPTPAVENLGTDAAAAIKDGPVSMPEPEPNPAEVFAKPQPAGLDGFGANIPPPPPAVAEVDRAGVVWNPELHSGNKTKKQDGTWKARKGTGVAVPVPPVPATVTVPPLPPIPPAPAVNDGPVAVGAPPVPSADAAPVSFRAVMTKISTNQAVGKLSKAAVDAALTGVGFKPDELAPLVLPANAQLLAAFNQLIDAALVSA